MAGEGAKLADLAQSEIQAEKSLTMRDRLSVKSMIAQQEKCAGGYKDCPELSGMMKTLDLYVTGEAISLSAQKQIVLRAVKTGDQKIAALAVGPSLRLLYQLRLIVCPDLVLIHHLDAGRIRCLRLLARSFALFNSTRADTYVDRTRQAQAREAATQALPGTDGPVKL